MIMSLIKTNDDRLFDVNYIVNFNNDINEEELKRLKILYNSSVALKLNSNNNMIQYAFGDEIQDAIIINK